jgi:SAM-dependent methyltransferase
VTADACRTGLPPDRFDLVYCRFLLLHLLDPAACLQEMWRVLKPGGILLVEDGDLASASSVPPTALDAFAELFSRLGPMRGVDYSLANRLWHLVAQAGFCITNVRSASAGGASWAEWLATEMECGGSGPGIRGCGFDHPRRIAGHH